MQSQKKIVSHNNNSLFYWFPKNRKNEIQAILGLLLILLIFRYQAVLLMNTYYLGSVQGDAGLYAWLLKSNLPDIFSLGWFDKLAFYPYSKVLAWSDNFILPSLVASPLYALGLSEAFVFNFMILLAGFLNGYCTYSLCFRLSGESFASFFAGCTFMTLPYFTHHLGHPQLEFFFFVPLGISTFVEFLNYPSYRKACLPAIVTAAAFLTTVFYSVFMALIYAILLASVKIIRPHRISSAFLKPLLLSAMTFSILLLPFILPYVSVKNAFGERQIYEAYYFSANILSYLSSTPFNFLYGATASLSHSEAHLFPGIVLSALSIMAISRLAEAKKLKRALDLFYMTVIVATIVTLLPSSNFNKVVTSLLLWASIVQALFVLLNLGKLEKKLNVYSITARDLIGIFCFIGFVFFCISLGPIGNPEKGQPALSPYSFLYTLFPGFSSIRAISRAGSVFLFCTCIASSIYLSILFKKKAFKGIAVIALVFCLLENFNLSYPISALPAAPDNIQQLATIEPKAAVAFLPFAGELDSNNEVESWAEYAKLNMTYLLWSHPLKNPLLNGYSGQKTKLMKEFPRELKDFPSQRALNALSSIAGLRYVIYAPLFAANFDAKTFESKAASLSSQLKLLSLDAQGSYLFEIHPEIQTAGNKLLLYPAQHGGKMELEIRTAYKISSEKLKVNVFTNEAEKGQPFAFLEIPADGSWSKQSFSLPLSAEKVRKGQVSFSTDNEDALVIKNIGLAK